MSQPDYPETVYCPSGHAYSLDELSDEQRDQVEVCPYCNPNTQGDSLRLRGRAIKV